VHNNCISIIMPTSFQVKASPSSAAEATNKNNNKKQARTLNDDDDNDEIISGSGPPPPKKTKLCTFQGCTNPHFDYVHEKEYCIKHYTYMIESTRSTAFLVSPGNLGLTLAIDNNNNSNNNNLPSARCGATITAIDPKCTFQERIEVGDRIVSIDNHKITKVSDLDINSDKIRKILIAKKNASPSASMFPKKLCCVALCTNRARLKGGVCKSHRGAAKVVGGGSSIDDTKGTTMQSTGHGEEEQAKKKTRPRKICCVALCTNRAQYKGGVCKSHRGAAKVVVGATDDAKETTTQTTGHGEEEEAKKKTRPPSKKRKKICSVGLCTNQARYKGGVCRSHIGAAAKVGGECSSIDDDDDAKGTAMQSTERGEEEEAKKKARPQKQRKICSVGLCTNQARIKGGVCRRHGAVAKVVGECTSIGAAKETTTQITEHGEEEQAKKKARPPSKKRRKICSVGLCTNQARIKGGVCRSHIGAAAKVVGECSSIDDAKGTAMQSTEHGEEEEAKKKAPPPSKKRRKICSVGLCTNQARIKGGVCRRHGAEAKIGGECTSIDAAKETTVQITEHGEEAKKKAPPPPKHRCVDGRTKRSRRHEVCEKHERVKRKLCDFDECSNQSVRGGGGGVCTRQGAKRAMMTQEDKFESSASTRELELESENKALKVKLAELTAELAAAKFREKERTMI
jgi:hypothetical protein